MQEIGILTEKLFGDIPKGVLYHYTTLTGLLGIVGGGTLWASDIRYMNDSAELRHSADLIHQEVKERIAQGHGKADLLGQFDDWVSHRITNGHMLFGASFRSHGNLLSQWRGYSTHGKGVSLGFAADYIRQCAHRQHFQIGKCIYDSSSQQRLIRQVLDAVESQVEQQLRGGESCEQLSAIYHLVFEQIEIDLLKIAAVIKHPSFREEKEWRIVSPVYTDASAPISFREANAMLVPYVKFALQPDADHPIQLDHLFLGPTSNIGISMNSLKMFLGQNGIVPTRGIDYCRIPYRQR
ncbi:DUF2971 domain-containing protein [Desulfogranum mediterraneum]|uniref:DUF2971 domain-containing protein n=1 Tax=Desulfogranum mediterraneum TaxID=160661 RepID=UPI00042541C1|nr:DUF2971 domain-containing protein [Desulfogranum mediterraneum]